MAKQQQKATTTTKRTAGEEDVKLRRMTTQAAASAITHASSRNIPAAAPSARRTTTATTNTATTSTIAQRDISYLYSSLFAGMSSGAVSAFVCAPLDLVRTRLQVWGDVAGGSRRLAVWTMFRDIVAADGVKGCFRGLTATLLTVPAFWGVYFPLYDDFKWHWSRQYPDANPSVIHMGSAVAAGAISDVICNPMFVVRTRLQTEAVHHLVWQKQHVGRMRPPKSTIAQIVRQLYAEGGLPIFWRGMTANLLGLTHVAVQFPVYERLKTKLRQRQHKLVGQETAGDLLLASGLSKVTASLLTYPHEVIRSRMMDARTSVTIVGTIRRLYATEGLTGFYMGLPISLIRVIPNTMLTFLVYETTLRFMRG